MTRYLQAMLHNSSVLIRLAQVLKNSSDAGTAEVAQTLSAEAVDIRASILVVWFKTLASIIFPSHFQVAGTVVTSYERMKSRVLYLRGLLAPDLQESQVTSWL